MKHTGRGTGGANAGAHSSVKFVRLLREDGTAPESALLLTSRYCRLGRLPTDAGSVPANWLSLTYLREGRGSSWFRASA